MTRETVTKIMLDTLVLYNTALGMDVFDDSKFVPNFQKLMDNYLEGLE